MVSNVKVLLTADNNDETIQLVGAMCSNGMDVKLCNKNGAELIDSIKSMNPDVVIMDAFMNHIDALGVLMRINAMNPVKRPLIIVMSYIDNSDLQKTFIREGADYCFIKPIEARIVAERVVQMLSWKGVGVFSNFQTFQEPELVVSDILHRVGIPIKVKGFRYLREAILLVIENPDIINSVTKILYPAIAEKYNSDPKSVERDMRYAIKIAWDNGHVVAFKSYFSCAVKNPKKPTNSEFICLISDDLRFKMKMRMQLDGPYKSQKRL